MHVPPFSLPLFGVAFSIAAASALALTPEQVFRRASASVVVVSTSTATGRSISSGSGVAIANSTSSSADHTDLIVTNCHVIDGGDVVNVEKNRRRIQATVNARLDQHDLCLLLAPGLSAPPALIGEVSRLQPGHRVYAIGNPRGLEMSLSDGVFSGIRTLGNTTVVQVTAPISPGSSGGGLFDSDARLLGLTSFALRESQNLNFAVAASHLAEFSVSTQPSKGITQKAAPTAAAAGLEPLDFKGIRIGDAKSDVASIKGMTCPGHLSHCYLVVTPLDSRLEFIGRTLCTHQCDERFSTIAGVGIIQAWFHFYEQRLDNIKIFFKTEDAPAVRGAIAEKYGRNFAVVSSAPHREAPDIPNQAILWTVGGSEIRLETVVQVRYWPDGPRTRENAATTLGTVDFTSARAVAARRATSDRAKRDI